MITHTSDLHQIPSQKKSKSKLQILKNCQKIQIFEILQETLHATHLLKLLDKMYEYEMDQTKTVDTGCGTDWLTDGRSETNIPHQQLCCAGV